MPSAKRSRVISVEPDAVWRLIADPHNLPRWWPETMRVENVEGKPGARRSRFTQVFETRQGSPVRADFRCTESTRPDRLVWDQQIEGTPFDKFLKAAELEFRIDGDPAGSKVTLEGRRTLRGLSKLGAPMMSRATRRSLSAALEGMAAALEGGTDR